MVYHYSEFSGILELKKPDIIPPTVPVFTDYHISEDGIHLSWEPSSSKDVIKQNLYKKTDTSKWKIVYSEDTNADEHSYFDNNVQPGLIYEYTIEAVDDDSLTSGKAYPVRLKMIDLKTRPSVKQITAFKNEKSDAIDLTWDNPFEGVHGYILLKSINGSGFFTYKQFDKGIMSFSDDHVREDHSYKYALQVIYEDGKKTPLGKIIELKY